MKFQALGSNYTFRWAMKQLVSIGSTTDSKLLVKALEQRYGGHAFLYSKGRNALSQAVHLSNEDGMSATAVNGLTCSVVIEAIQAAKSSPVYLDIDPGTAHFSAQALEHALVEHKSIGAVVVQNTYGHMVDIAAIEAIAKQHNLVLIEDLAHSVGQTYPDGREAGTVGDLVMLSFGRDKLLDVVNGGALVVRSPQLIRSIQPPSKFPTTTAQLRDRIYPMLTWKVRKFYNVGLGKAILALMYKLGLATRSAEGGINHTETMPYWQARLARQRLAALDTLNEHRRSIMSVYREEFGDILISNGGTIRAALAVRDRIKVLQELREAGYELVDTWYDTPIGPEREFRSMNYPIDACPASVALSESVINLPTHDEITVSDAKQIAAIARRYV